MSDTAYCLCCNEDVPFGIVERNQRKEAICNFCGFTLDVQKVSDPHNKPGEGHALVADDSKFTRKIIEELLREKNFSSVVNSFEKWSPIALALFKTPLREEGRRCRLT